MASPIVYGPNFSTYVRATRLELRQQVRVIREGHRVVLQGCIEASYLDETFAIKRGLTWGEAASVSPHHLVLHRQWRWGRDDQCDTANDTYRNCLFLENQGQSYRHDRKTALIGIFQTPAWK